MDSARRSRLGILLIVFGALGLLTAASLLPYGFGALDFEQVLQWRGWLAWGFVAAGYLPYLVVVLSVLLLVAGRNLGYIGAGLGTALAIGYAVAVPQVSAALAVSGSPKAHMTLSLVLALGTLIVAVLALLSALRLRRGTSESQESPSA
jgi:hypothetical protein